MQSENDIDPRLKLLSYSSLLTLHECPRKFQLYRLNVQEDSEEEDTDASLTFAFGHAVGEGVQKTLEGLSVEEITWNLFLQWPCELDAQDDKRKKSFFLALYAVDSFHSQYHSNILLDGYDLVYLENGKPAVEMSFKISFHDGFQYRGFVDAVLKHRTTGEIIILEIKTTSVLSLNPNQYKNSSQAVGYSVVLDRIFKDLSSYKVLYLVYKTKEFTFEQLPFSKSFLQRALWIQELLFDIESIERAELMGTYPMRGENCLGKYFKECKYLNICTMSTEYLTNNSYTPREEPEYTFNFDIKELIHSQLHRE